MPEYSGTATLRSKYWDDTGFVVKSSTDSTAVEEARQGMVNGYKRVGLMQFSLANVLWSSKVIKKITFTLTHGSSGRYNGSNKTFSFYTSKYQKISDTKNIGGKSTFGDSLGTVTKACSRNTNVTITLPNDNSTLFSNIVNYIKQTGVNTFCLYINDTAHLSGETYSANYLSVTYAKIVIEYEDATVYYNNNGTWETCLVYYNDNGTWKQCIPYYNKDGTWIQV